METVLGIASIVSFVLAGIAAVAAVVIFVRADVMNAIRFLQHRPTKERKVSDRKARERVKAVAANSTGKLSDPVADGPTDEMQPMSGKADSRTDNLGSRRRKSIVVEAGAASGGSRKHGTQASDAGTDLLGHTSERVEPLPRKEDSEQPTGLLPEEESEQPTGLLPEEGSEQPTGLLSDEESEQPTGLLLEDESEQPTGLLAEDGSEQPTGLLVEEESEQPTGILVEIEPPLAAKPKGVAEEESERPTGLLEEDESELPTGILQVEGAVDDLPGVVQHDEQSFRFILRHDEVVVHTDEVIE